MVVCSPLVEVVCDIVTSLTGSRVLKVNDNVLVISPV